MVMTTKMMMMTMTMVMMMMMMMMMMMTRIMIKNDNFKSVICYFLLSFLILVISHCQKGTSWT